MTTSLSLCALLMRQIRRLVLFSELSSSCATSGSPIDRQPARRSDEPDLRLMPLFCALFGRVIMPRRNVSRFVRVERLRVEIVCLVFIRLDMVDGLPAARK